MEFRDVITRRRMVRAFTGEPLEPAAIKRLLTAANRAPSAGFSQGYALLALQGPGELGPFWEIVDPGPQTGDTRNPLTRAPFVVVPLSCKQIPPA